VRTPGDKPDQTKKSFFVVVVVGGGVVAGGKHRATQQAVETRESRGAGSIGWWGGINSNSIHSFRFRRQQMISPAKKESNPIHP